MDALKTSKAPKGDDAVSLLQISATLARELDEARQQLSSCKHNLESTQKALAETRDELRTCQERSREFESNWAAAASAAVKATQEKVVASDEERAAGTKASVYLLLLILAVGVAAVLAFKGRLLIRGAASPSAISQFCAAAGGCQVSAGASGLAESLPLGSISPLSASASCGLTSTGTCSAPSFTL